MEVCLNFFLVFLFKLIYSELKGCFLWFWIYLKQIYFVVHLQFPWSWDAFLKTMDLHSSSKSYLRRKRQLMEFCSLVYRSSPETCLLLTRLKTAEMKLSLPLSFAPRLILSHKAIKSCFGSIPWHAKCDTLLFAMSSTITSVTSSHSNT